MKTHAAGIVACALAAGGFVGLVWCLHAEIASYHRAVQGWAERDLSARVELAARSLAEPLATGDFRALQAFASSLNEDAVRLTVLAERGGMVFDSNPSATGAHGARPEVDRAKNGATAVALRRSSTTGEDTLYAARRAGDFIVRLALPTARVFAPERRTRTALVLSGLVGACGLLFVTLFTARLRARVRRLAAERDEQARRLEEMKRAERFRREFVANVSHEIKTPLTGILGAVQLLEGEGADAPTAAERTELVGMIRRESNRLDSLVRDVLTLAKLEEDPSRTHATFVATTTGDVVEEVSGAFAERAAKAGVELASSAAPTIPLRCDRRLVVSALGNLVSNAIAYSGSKRIEIACAENADAVAFAVVDHGRGIPVGHRARIFERFYRIEGDRAAKTGGTGLGLAIVKHVATLHGGDATLDETPGGGCRFAFTLSKRTNNENTEENT